MSAGHQAELAKGRHSMIIIELTIKSRTLSINCPQAVEIAWHGTECWFLFAHRL